MATIGVNRSGPGGSSYPTLKNGKFVARNISMLTLLQAAYALTMLRIVGPGWMEKERYDLDGKSPEGVSDSQLIPMLQALVKDRFQIVSHRETREMPIVELRTAKEGAKMSAYDPAHPIVPAPNRGRGGAVIVGRSLRKC